MRFRFEKLEVWQEARAINRAVYVMSRGFPRNVAFGMTPQIRRAAASISANIAEGSGRNSDKDFAHFLELAYGSLMEVAALCYLAFDEGYVLESNLNPLLDNFEKLARRLAALNRSLAVKASKTPFVRRNVLTLDPRPSTLDQ